MSAALTWRDYCRALAFGTVILWVPGIVALVMAQFAMILWAAAGGEGMSPFLYWESIIVVILAILAVLGAIAYGLAWTIVGDTRVKLAEIRTQREREQP
jgi:Na+/melibiose symporter-like transporter